MRTTQGHAIPAIYIERKRGHLGPTDSPRSSRMLWGLDAPMEAFSTSRKRSRASSWIRSISSRREEKEISFSHMARVSPRRIHYRHPSVLYTRHRWQYAMAKRMAGILIAKRVAPRCANFAYDDVSVNIMRPHRGCAEILILRDLLRDEFDKVV